jgi:hypothetical protein
MLGILEQNSATRNHSPNLIGIAKSVRVQSSLVCTPLNSHASSTEGAKVGRTMTGISKAARTSGVLILSLRSINTTYCAG